ncbi:hypothetical protein [Clostridium paraputrificum]|uniref:hypothetical protein n=2 Tax=Clostridiaceae TaxID=31979 RepID=UPI001899DD7A|nr:hypothetical protein [Clostridium paraputrificum]
MKKCLYCNKKLKGDYFSNKIGNFCSENHFDDYLKSLSKEEYVALQHSFCVCSDDWSCIRLRFFTLG